MECKRTLRNRATTPRMPLAPRVFERAVGFANDLGLPAEEVNPVTGELLGNVPQAFSHIGLVNATWAFRKPNGKSSPDHVFASMLSPATISTLWTREHARTNRPRSPACMVLVRSKINWNPRSPGHISGESPRDQHRHHRRNRHIDGGQCLLVTNLACSR